MNKIAEKAIGSASDGVRKLNPHLFGQLPPQNNPQVECARPKVKTLCEVFAAEGKRIRQGEPKQGKWELEWKRMLEASGDWLHVRAQSFRVRLANGAWYKGDVTATNKGPIPRLHVWEVKGGKGMKGVAKGTLALKVAAAQYPEICWTLVWKENGKWQAQEVLP